MQSNYSFMIFKPTEIVQESVLLIISTLQDQQSQRVMFKEVFERVSLHPRPRAYTRADLRRQLFK